MIIYMGSMKKGSIPIIISQQQKKNISGFHRMELKQYFDLLQ